MPTPQIRVDCYLRAASLAGPMDETLTTIEGFAEDGTIDEWAVHTWPSEVVLSDATDHVDVVETYRTFEAWADQQDVRIDPPFTVETRTSQLTGGSRDVLVTPVLCLAISAGGSLQEVLPHRTDETTYTVEDALGALARGEVTVNAGLTPPLTIENDHCPWCEMPLDTGQGLYVCADCDWVGIATGPGTYRPYRAGFPGDERSDEGTSTTPPLPEAKGSE